MNNTNTMLNAAQQGLDIGRMIHPLVKEQLATGTLIPILPDHWYPYPGLYLYFMQTNQKARRVRVLVDFLKNQSLTWPNNLRLKRFCFFRIFLFGVHEYYYRSKY